MRYKEPLEKSRLLLIKTALLATTLLFATGCSHVSYLMQAGMGQLALYNHERPLKEVIDDPRTPENVRERLKWVPEIKKQVEDELGVKATSNYTTYVKLDRPYVIWSLTAAPAFELQSVRWSFPLVGAFPYLGFFKEQTAGEWAKDYDEKGYDTYVRGVGAYSTLGYLRDPLLSSMLSRDKSEVVNLIFHETTHSQLYIRSQVGFNEQLASYIGDVGERMWIVQTHGPESAELKRWNEGRADRRRFGEILRKFADELDAYYKASIARTDVERRQAKAERYRELARRLESEPWRGRGFARTAARITNNAALLAFLTYEDDQALFELLDKKCERPGDALRYLKSFEQDWNRLSAGDPGLRPQDILRDRLLRKAGGVVCLYPDVN